jgi:hypothetical protein
VYDLCCVFRIIAVVRVANRHTCAMFGGVPLRSRVGYLAAISAVDSMVGTSECPWFIDIDQGQRVNLSIHGTAWNTVGDITSTVDCPLRLVVHDDNKTTVLLVCPDVSRYESCLGQTQLICELVFSGHIITIKLLSAEASEKFS